MRLNIFKPFWPFLRPYKRQLVLGLTLLTLAQIVASAMPYVVKLAIDTVKESLDGAEGTVWSKQQVLDEILWYAGCIFGLSIVQMGLQIGMRWYVNSIARYAEFDIRQIYFGHLLKLSLNYYHQTATGDLMSRATNDLNTIRMFLAFGIRMLLDGTLAVSFTLAVMCSIDWQLSIYTLLPMPFLAVAMNRVASGVHIGYRDLQEQFSTISARVQENLAGIRVVKAYVQREGEIKVFDQLNREYLERAKKLIRLESIIRPISFAIGGASLIMILWEGGERVIRGEISLGDFVAFNAYVIKLMFPMMTMGWMMDRYQRAMASMARIEGVLSEEPEISDAKSPKPLTDIRGEITFRNLNFSYDGTPVLKNINLHIPAGSTLAVVGRVGSGKTTLSRMLPRLIQSEQESVFIDGVPVQQIPLNLLRENIGYVPQDTFLFSDTLRENIAFGVEDSSEEEVNWASEVAQLSKDLKDLPQGLDTMSGERGVTLSGGQKQRTALARAVIRKPKILILDDSMASVDTHTEEEILSGLKSVMADRTTILIAHRISTVQGADQIVVLDKGEIAEQGTHEELIALDGIYTDMYRRQQLARQLDEI